MTSSLCATPAATIVHAVGWTRLVCKIIGGRSSLGRYPAFIAVGLGVDIEDEIALFQVENITRDATLAVVDRATELVVLLALVSRLTTVEENAAVLIKRDVVEVGGVIVTRRCRDDNCLGDFEHYLRAPLTNRDVITKARRPV